MTNKLSVMTKQLKVFVILTQAAVAEDLVTLATDVFGVLFKDTPNVASL